ncbi:hypothetical protein OAG16_03745 [Saprospiraceae bacterium]|nr:hypothetical protein [Saprospiraceae bacterium]
MKKLTNSKFTFLIVVLFFSTIFSCENHPPNINLLNNDILTHESKEQIGIPGERTCFWLRGPHSKDPYINIAYPDAGVFYWNSMFTIPKGAKLELEGEFPHSRYMSLISYNEFGQPIESLADYLIVPDEGGVNPFIVGAERNNPNRKYTIEVASSQPKVRKKEGIRLSPSPQLEEQKLEQQIFNTIHAPAYDPGQQSLLYRIYVPDQAYPVTGGVKLPEPVLTLADGRVLRGEDACKVLDTKQPLYISPSAVSVPMKKYHELVNLPDKPYAHPATNPPTWFIQYDRAFLLGIYSGQMPESARKSTGGFYPNLDNNYVRAIINRKHGKVFVLRGKLPQTPKTLNGEEKMTAGQLVYWSLCSNQGFANTRVNDCLFDEQVPVNDKGEYVIAISRVADRPRNAYSECGIGWLPMADDGDGALDEDVTVIQIRNMLASPDFKEAIQNVIEIGTEKEVMGAYLPDCFYVTPGAFETFFPCMLKE